MRGQTLVSLLDDLRAEARLSLNSALNAQVRDHQIKLLQREQVRLWEEFPWPHLRVERLIPVQEGQRFYSPPSDVLIDRIEKFEFKDVNTWIPLMPQINRENYAVWDSQQGRKSWPVSAWRIWEGEQIEVWPVPSKDADDTTQNGYLKITGIRNLKPLVADTDTTDLDGRLIVLYAAANLLAANGSKDAQIKLDAANRMYTKLKGHLMPNTRFSVFGTAPIRRQGRPIISRYTPFVNY